MRQMHEPRLKQLSVGFEAHAANDFAPLLLADDMEVLEYGASELRLQWKRDLISSDRAMNYEDADTHFQLGIKNGKLRIGNVALREAWECEKNSPNRRKFGFGANFLKQKGISCAPCGIEFLLETAFQPQIDHTMLAIVEISGEQFKIDGATKRLRIPYQKDAAAGEQVAVSRVLMSQGDDGKVTFGSGTAPTAKVIGHIRGEKVIVFHKKRRKRYRKTNGHTPKFTEVAISW